MMEITRENIRLQSMERMRLEDGKDVVRVVLAVSQSPDDAPPAMVFTRDVDLSDTAEAEILPTVHLWLSRWCEGIAQALQGAGSPDR